MFSWRRATGCGLFAIVVLVLSGSYLIRERLDFVAKCYANGNTLRGCSCTFSALPKLSSNYQDLARSWAIDPSENYVRSVLYSLAKETLKASTGISKDLVGNNANAKSYAGWLRNATSAIGWPQTKRVVEGTAQVLATTAAAKTIVIPVVLAGTELQSARDTMGQACGAYPHFLTPVDRTFDAMVSAARDSSKWIFSQAATAGDAASDTIIAGGNVATNAARRVGIWLGIVRISSSDENSNKEE